MEKVDLELYTDYLLSTSGATTATGLSAMVDGEVSHDRISRFLAQRDYTSKDLWLQVKSTVRRLEDAEGVLIFDDTIQEKVWFCRNKDFGLSRYARGSELASVRRY